MKRRRLFPWEGWPEDPAAAFPGLVRLQAIAQRGQAQPLIAPLGMQPELPARPAVWLQRLLARPARLLQVLALPVGIPTNSRLHSRQLRYKKELLHESNRQTNLQPDCHVAGRI